MSRFTVDPVLLEQFADDLRNFTLRAESVAEAVDERIAQLHTTWHGAGADSHEDFHHRWMVEAIRMRESVEALRAAVEGAQRNYMGAVKANVQMWR